ncbi:MAG: hypothetical protein KKC84_03260 [Candidatus Omnitrophica bacterium]|nr:hypothetical protein [Candidatus Omnitrophota bacterium]
MKRKNLFLLFKILILCVALAVPLGLGYWVIRNNFLTSDFFRIREVIIKEVNASPTGSAALFVLPQSGGTIDLSYLKGENIFTVDLRRQSRYILDSYPAYRKVHIVKVFPRRLFVLFIRRVPAAAVKLYKMFFVDEEAVFFDSPDHLGEMGVTVIEGLETRIFGPKTGMKYDSPELLTSLEIIKSSQRYGIARVYPLTRLVVESPSEIRFFLKLPPRRIAVSFGKDVEKTESLEVKISNEEVPRKMEILSKILYQEHESLARIIYIDLRFNEPVLKLSDDTAKQ